MPAVSMHRILNASRETSTPRPRIAWVVAVALALCFIYTSARAEVPFRSDSLGFSVIFPTAPEMEESEILAPSGPAQLIRLSTKDSKVRASLTLVSFSRGPFSPDEIAAGLNVSRDNQVNRVSGRLIFQNDINLNGYAGKELMIAFGPPAKKYRYRGRTFYVGSRQFILSVIGVAGDVTSPGADDYLESFNAWE